MEEASAILLGALMVSVFLGSVLAWGVLLKRVGGGEEPLQYEPRVVVPWRGVDVLVLAFVYFACEIAAGGVLRVISGPNTGGVTPAVLAASSTARLFWLVLAAAYLLVRGSSYEDLGLDFSHWRRDLTGGLLLFLAAVVPVFGVQLFFTQFFEMPSDHPLLKLTREHSAIPVLVLATFAAVLVAPLFEEFLFRLLLQGWIEGEQVRRDLARGGEWMGRPGLAPLLVSSTLFALLHAQSMPDPAAIFVLALFLGYAYRQTHRMLPPLVIHAGVNGWTMLNVWLMYLGGHQV